MEPERPEVYERIPWETLETNQNSKQWLVYAVAGAIAVGALAYSFARSQPLVPETVAVSPTVPAPSVTEATPAPTVDAPVVLAEADLFAVDPDAFVQLAATHAEWVAMEYFSSDGSTSLLPAGLPDPVVPEGTSVFVDWVGASEIAEIDQVTYRVDVVVRSLIANGEGAFERQPTQLATFDIGIDPDGNPYVKNAPMVRLLAVGNETTLALSSPPPDVLAAAEAEHGVVLGGTQLADGSWSLVVMKTGVDGIKRPTTILR